MKRALALARRGVGRVHPNPLVGAVVVKNGRIVGEGAHRWYGAPHAEVDAIQKAGPAARGSALYVTLEPCAHQGKTPPCTDLILKHKIRRVVAAMKDPHPRVSGRGIRILKKSGVSVSVGVLEKRSRILNRDYLHWVRKKRPWVILKAAQTLDGKIATASGQSQWITGRPARVFGHRLRAGCEAILIGVETLLKDDPRLDLRFVHKSRGRRPPPLRVILDSRLRTPASARIFSRNSGGPVLIIGTRRAPLRKRRLLEKKAQVLLAPQKKGRVDLLWLLGFLDKRGIGKVLIEGGGELNASAFSAKAVDEVYFFIAPEILGGKRSISSVGGEEALSLKKAWRIRRWEARRLGRDLLVHGVL